MPEKSVKQDWIIVGILPILLGLISDRWMFLPVQYWFDPWFYLGIYLDYEYLASLHPNSYFITRLPSIIPHFYAYKLLSPYAAVIATTLLKFYLCIIPLYWVLWEITKNRLASLLPIFVLSFFPYFLSSIGWHYVDGLGIGYISLATAFFIAACKKENWKLWLFLAGFAQALMLFNYLFLAIFIVIQVVFFIFHNKSHGQRSLLTCLMFLGAGGLFCTICLSSFSYYYSSTILFFMPQIQAAFHLSSLTYIASGKNSVWYMPFKEWFSTSSWLFLSGVIFFLSIHYFFKHIKGQLKFSLNLQNLTVSQFLIACLFYVTLEFLGFNFLQYFYTANYLLPFSILALGVIVVKNMPLLKYENRLIGLILFIFSIIFSLKGDAATVGRSWGCIIFHLIGCLIFSAFFLKSTKKHQKVFFLIINILLVTITFNRLTTNKNNSPYKDHGDHELVVHLHQYIKNRIPSKNNYVFWYNNQSDTLGGFFQPLSATYLNPILSDKFPEIYEQGFSEKSNKTIILLSSDPDAVQKAEKALKQKGYDWNILKQEKFVLNEKQFLMLAFLLKPIGNE